jgi:hypothetical protein
MPRTFGPSFAPSLCALLLFACSAVAADDSTQPAPACPASPVQQTGWRAIELVKMGVRLKMPSKYREKHWAVTVGNPIVATFRAGQVETFTLKVDGPGARSLADHKVIRQPKYEGYTECTESISGHPAVIQAFREPGVIFTARWHPAFAVHAVADLGPGRVLRFSGTAATRRGQEELLAILRTIEFTR